MAGGCAGWRPIQMPAQTANSATMRSTGPPATLLGSAVNGDCREGLGASAAHARREPLGKRLEIPASSGCFRANCAVSTRPPEDRRFFSDPGERTSGPPPPSAQSSRECGHCRPRLSAVHGDIGAGALSGEDALLERVGEPGLPAKGIRLGGVPDKRDPRGGDLPGEWFFFGELFGLETFEMDGVFFVHGEEGPRSDFRFGEDVPTAADEEVSPQLVLPHAGALNEPLNCGPKDCGGEQGLQAFSVRDGEGDVPQPLEPPHAGAWKPSQKTKGFVGEQGLQEFLGRDGEGVVLLQSEADGASDAGAAASCAKAFLIRTSKSLGCGGVAPGQLGKRFESVHDFQFAVALAPAIPGGLGLPGLQGLELPGLCLLGLDLLGGVRLDGLCPAIPGPRGSSPWESRDGEKGMMV